MSAEDVGAILVGEGRLAPDRLDEARERHVLAGGLLDTALLETGVVDEAAVQGALARFVGQKVVGKAEIDAVAKTAVALLPKKVAEKHRVVPIALNGRKLTVAVAGVPDLALLDEIGFMVSLYLRPVVTTEARLAYGLQRHYDVPVPPRLQSLLLLLGEQGDLPPAAKPDEASIGATIQVGGAAPLHEPVFGPVDGDDVEVPRLDLRTGDEFSRWRAREQRAPSDAAAAAVRAAMADEAPPEPAAAWSVVRGDFAGLPPHDGPATTTVPAPARAEGALLSGGPDESARRAAEQRVLARIEEDDFERRLREDVRREHRVLWTVDDAIAELALADGRDEMLEVVLKFAYRRLNTVAIFVFHSAGGRDPSFVGWDVIDPFMTKRDVERLSVPAVGQHVLAQVVEMKSPFLGPLRDGDPLLRLLGRRPRAIVLVPILVGDRLAGVVYGDCGVRSIPPSGLAELHMVVPRLGKALGNLIVRKKKRAHAAALAATAPEPVQLDDTDLEVVEGAELIVDEDVDGMMEALVAEAAAAALASLPVKRSEVAAADVLAEEEVAAADGFENVVSNIRVQDGAAGFDDEASVPPVQEPEGFDDTRERPPPLPDDEAQGGPRPAPSPGARARESLLTATWNAWVAHEDEDTDGLLGGLHQPGEAGRGAVLTIVARGLRAMPTLARYFPGVVDKHPFGDMDVRPEPARFSDCLACLVKLGPDLSAPILVAELEHEDRLHRYAATWALSAMRVPAALPRLAARVFDPEMRVAATALEVLDGYRREPTFAAVMDDLRSYLRRGDAFQRRRAILAACELRDRDALTPVVDLLGTRPKEVAEEARRALVEITKQDFATSERKWRAWIDEHARVPRVRWLIDALAHKDDQIRKSAQSELNRVTGQYFGFRWDAARAERDASIQVWNAWWAEQRDKAKWP